MSSSPYTDAVREEIKTGDCIQWQSNSILGKLIRIFSPQINHSSLALRLDYKGLEDRRFLLEALEMGIDMNLLSMRLDDYDGKAWWYKLHSKFDSLREHIGAWALKRVGTPYDYGSLFKNMMGRVSADANKFFCSEYVYLCYLEHRIVPRMKAPRPGDLIHLPIWERIERIR